MTYTVVYGCCDNKHYCGNDEQLSLQISPFVRVFILLFGRVFSVACFPYRSLMVAVIMKRMGLVAIFPAAVYGELLAQDGIYRRTYALQSAAAGSARQSVGRKEADA